eukprot:217494-Pleurochrysis_carterae.AAC.2
MGAVYYTTWNIQLCNTPAQYFAERKLSVWLMSHNDNLPSRNKSSEAMHKVVIDHTNEVKYCCIDMSISDTGAVDSRAETSVLCRLGHAAFPCNSGTAAAVMEA